MPPSWLGGMELVLSLCSGCHCQHQQAGDCAMLMKIKLQTKHFLSLMNNDQYFFIFQFSIIKRSKLKCEKMKRNTRISIFCTKLFTSFQLPLYRRALKGIASRGRGGFIPFFLVSTLVPFVLFLAKSKYKSMQKCCHENKGSLTCEQN